jgi:hypothetical protein
MWVKHGKTMISHLGMVTIAPIYGDDWGCKWSMKSQDCRCRYHVAFVDEGHRAEQKATIGYHNLHAWYIKYMHIYILYIVIAYIYIIIPYTYILYGKKRYVLVELDLSFNRNVLTKVGF